MPSPTEVQRVIDLYSTGKPADTERLKNFLIALSEEDYNAWARSDVRASGADKSTAQKIKDTVSTLLPIVGAAAGVAGVATFGAPGGGVAGSRLIGEGGATAVRKLGPEAIARAAPRGMNLQEEIALAVRLGRQGKTVPPSAAGKFLSNPATRKVAEVGAAFTGAIGGVLTGQKLLGGSPFGGGGGGGQSKPSGTGSSTALELVRMYERIHGDLSPADEAKLSVFFSTEMARVDPTATFATLDTADKNALLGRAAEVFAPEAVASATGDYDPEELLAIGIIPRGNTGIYYDETTGFEGPLQEVFAARRDYLATKLRGSGGGTRFQPQLGVDPDGREYIWDPNTQTKNYTGNTFDPTRQTTSIYDDTTGYTSLIDAQTGEIISSFQTGYAGLDPQEKFAADEAYRSATLRADAEARRGQFEIQSAQLLQQALANRRQQELEAQRQVAEILRNPSDYISAAFLQRGKPAPSATVTHADLINRLYEQTGTGQPKSFATGGATTAGKFMVGDKPNRTTGAEEIILNPTNAPITVIPANGSFTGPRFATGTSTGWLAALEKANEEYAGRAANPSGTIPSLTVGRGPEHQFSNVTPEQAAAVANFFGAKPAPTASTSPVNPTVTQTTPAFDWEKYYEMERADRRAFLEEFRNIFNRPLGQPTSQSELVSQAQTNSPPAVSALLSGQRQDPLRFKFPLFSPRQLGQLTPNELKALSSRLGVGFNTSLDDVRAAQEQRYGGSFYPKARFLRG